MLRLLLFAPLVCSLDLSSPSSELIKQPHRSFELFKRAFDRKYEDEHEEAKRYMLDLLATIWHNKMLLGRSIFLKLIGLCRFEYFKRSLKTIHKSTTDHIIEGEVVATFGLNNFADQSPDEKDTMTCGAGTKKSRNYGVGMPLKPTYWDGRCTTCKKFPALSKGASSPPIDPTTKQPGWDWAEHGAVTDVKFQGGCGGCWAFGAAGDVEGSHFMSGHDLVSLSVQQLISCDHSGGDQGCGGSTTNLDSYEYVMQNGLVADKTYPFSNASTHGSTTKCDTSKLANPIAKVSGSWQISGIGHLNDSYPGNNETFPGGSPWNTSVAVDEKRVIDALLKTGPMSITIRVNGGFGSYTGGVLCPTPTGDACPLYCCYPPGNKYSLLDHEVDGAFVA
jgi:hypothetical protein